VPAGVFAQNFPSYVTSSPVASSTVTGDVIPLIRGALTYQIPASLLSGIPQPVINGDCLIGSGGVPIWGSCAGGATVANVSNSDGTLTISPTTGSVVASLALGHANTWTGQQTFVAPILGTPASGVATNLTGTAAGLTAGNVTTNANLTGPVTSVGNATAIAAGAIALSKLGGEVDGQCILGVASAWSAAVCPGLTVGTTGITSGTTNRLLYDNGGVLGEAIVGSGLSLSSGTLTATAGGGGTVTNTAGTLTAHAPIIGNGSADIKALAALTNGQIVVGATGADPAPQSMSQDCTMTSAGIVTCTKTNNVAFATSATTDTTNATNITSGTLPAGRLPVRASMGGAPGNPSSTSNLTDTMMGSGNVCFITPNTTGTVIFLYSGVAFNNTSGDGWVVKLWRGTGSPPANGTAATGTQMGGAPSSTGAGTAAGAAVGFGGISGRATGLAIGTTVWFDASVAAVTGGGAAIGGISCTAYELN
jgi:hypothetical protein